jgi:hypothetical protein
MADIPILVAGGGLASLVGGGLLWLAGKAEADRAKLLSSVPNMPDMAGQSPAEKNRVCPVR